MAGDQNSTPWWRDSDEEIVNSARAMVLYQYADSVVRRRFPGVFYLTDRRFVATWRGRRSERRRILPIDIPREHINTAVVVEAFNARSSVYRPWFGRRVLRLDVDHKGRDLALGLVLPTAEAEAWGRTLGDEPSDGQARTTPGPDPE